MRADFLCPKCDNFACWHTRQDKNGLHLNFTKSASPLSRSQAHFPALFKHLHTYVIGHYSPSVRIIDLVSHTTCVLILYISSGTYSLKSTPNDRFFEKLFIATLYQHSDFLPEICWEEIAEEMFFVFCFDIWLGARTLAFHLRSQHTTY